MNADTSRALVTAAVGAAERSRQVFLTLQILTVVVLLGLLHSAPWGWPAAKARQTSLALLLAKTHALEEIEQCYEASDGGPCAGDGRDVGELQRAAALVLRLGGTIEQRRDFLVTARQGALEHARDVGSNFEIPIIGAKTDMNYLTLFGVCGFAIVLSWFLLSVMKERSVIHRLAVLHGTSMPDTGRWAKSPQLADALEEIEAHQLFVGSREHWVSFRGHRLSVAGTLVFVGLATPCVVSVALLAFDVATFGTGWMIGGPVLAWSSLAADAVLTAANFALLAKAVSVHLDFAALVQALHDADQMVPPTAPAADAPGEPLQAPRLASSR